MFNFVRGNNVVVKDPRVKRLLEFSEKIPGKDLVPVLVEEAAPLIREDPFAFALAAVLDRGQKAEVIWTLPYFIKKQVGTLDPHFFANASLDELSKIFQELPRKPRYVGDAPRTVKELSKIVVNEYDGKVERIWNNRRSESVKATFRRVFGVGPGIASMIVLLLEKWYDVHFDDLDHARMDVKPDAHDVRVFHRLGFISEPKEGLAVDVARRLNPEYPGALDAPTWTIGKNWCTSYNPKCHDCPVREACPKYGVLKKTLT